MCCVTQSTDRTDDSEKGAAEHGWAEGRNEEAEKRVKGVGGGGGGGGVTTHNITKLPLSAPPIESCKETRRGSDCMPGRRPKLTTPWNWKFHLWETESDSTPQSFRATATTIH